jgi:universal stress protein A
MTSYRHILLAVDTAEESIQAAAKATELARRFAAKLSLLHVVETAPTQIASTPSALAMEPLTPLTPMTVEQENKLHQAKMKQAQAMLEQLAEDLNMPAGDRWALSSPSTKQVIHDVAKEHAIDLIVVGSHGRHGLALLLGSTANAVLHGAPCDVLAVRV